MERAPSGHRTGKAVVTGATAVLLAGAWLAGGLPVEWVPNPKGSAVSIVASWPGAPPRVVERQVTAPIEQAVSQVPGTKGVKTYSREGQAVVRLEVSADRGLDLYIAEVSDRLASLRRSLPAYVVPRVTTELPESLRREQGFMTLQLVGSTTPEELRRVADRIVAPRLRSLSGIASVVSAGGRERELLVALDPRRLETYKLSLEDVQGKLREAFAVRSFGSFFDRGSKTLLVSLAEESVGGVAHLSVGDGSKVGTAVRLSDVATVALGPAPVRSISRVDGKPVVTVTLDRTEGSHLLAVAADVRNALAGLRPELPAGVEVLVADDQSEEVKAELRSLGLRLGVGLAAVALVLLLSLRSWRAAGIVLFSTAVALAAGLGLLRLSGQTLNVLTLAGLSLLVGLLVNNAAILVDRHLGGRARAAGTLRLPLVASTATTAVVFIPMVYLSGELRSLFLPFAAVAALTLAFSLASASLLVPALARSLPVREPAHIAARRPPVAFFAFISRHRVAAILGLFLCIGLPTSLVPDLLEEPDQGWESPRQERFAARYNATMGSSWVRKLRRALDPLLGGVTRPFLDQVETGPSSDLEEKPEIVVWLKLPAGSGIERADELLRGFEELALASPAVERTIARVSEDVSLLRVLLERDELERSEPYLLRERLIGAAVQLAGVEVAVSGLVPMGFYSGVGNVSGLRVVVHGASYETLEAVTQDFARRVAADYRVAGVDVHAGWPGQPPSREVLRLLWNSDAVARTGARTADLVGLLRSRLSTWAPSLYTAMDGDPRVGVRVVSRDADRQDLSALLGEPLVRPNGGALRLADAAQLSVEREPAIIERENQQYKRHVEIFYRGPYRLGKEAIDREIRAMTPPPGYRIERPKYSFLTDAMKGELAWLILGTLALVYLVIAAVLESWRLAGLVMVSVPLAWIGIALGFLWSGESFGEGAFLGVVLAIGTSVNAGILLADRFRRLRAARPGTPASRLALLAVRNRLRPIWTTTLTSVAGVLPLLLLPGAKSFWVGLAITVVGGLLSSALLAPVAMVALLSRKTPGKKPGARLLAWERKVKVNRISLAVEGVAARTGCR